MTEPTKTLRTPKARIAFPHLFEKEVFKKGKPKYSVTLLFPKDTDLSKLKQAAKLAIEERWGNKKPKKLKTPFKNGDAVDDDGDLLYPYDGYEGCIVLKCSTEFDSLGIVDKHRQYITDPEEIYGGCYGRAHVTAAAYDQDTSKGVTFYLNHFQKLDDCEDDERFGNRVSAKDAFDDDVSEKSEADNAFDDDDDLLGGI
jgi:hypothetical protein